MLQSVAVCCIVMRCVAVCCRVLQRVAVCCSVMQCVAVCCILLQSVAVCYTSKRSCRQCPHVLHCNAVAVCCSVMQRDAVCCSVLQCIVPAEDHIDIVPPRVARRCAIKQITRLAKEFSIVSPTVISNRKKRVNSCL